MTSSKPKGLENDVQKMIHTVKIWITLQPLSTPHSGYLLFFFLFALGNIWAERDKMYIRLCAPNEVGDKLMHPRRLMRVFAIRLPKKSELSAVVHRSLSDEFADVHADLNLC